MIAMSMLIVGIFLLLSENLARAAEQAQGKSRVDIYLATDATPLQIANVDRYLAAHPDLARFHFVSREEAMRRFLSYFSNLNTIVAQLDGNPFPPSFECDVAPERMQTAAFLHEAKELRGIAGVDDVQFDWEWVRRLKRAVNIINIAGIVAGAVLALAAAFTIANVIRLTMMLYREEIDIMRLVGATERIIRGPFVVEGLLQGTLGALFAIALLFGGFEAARRFLAPANSIVWSFLFNGFLPWQKIAALLAGGMLAGSLGSWLSVRESGEEAA
ncbi:MAG TPA: ABC transporter permease [Thermoanaerobaculia bacterium]|nr:ABC transporter permease [Thermoanaerobaculia bacterium]